MPTRQDQYMFGAIQRLNEYALTPADLWCYAQDTGNTKLAAFATEMLATEMRIKEASLKSRASSMLDGLSGAIQGASKKINDMRASRAGNAVDDLAGMKANLDPGPAASAAAPAAGPSAGAMGGAVGGKVKETLDAADASKAQAGATGGAVGGKVRETLDAADASKAQAGATGGAVGSKVKETLDPGPAANPQEAAAASKLLPSLAALGLGGAVGAGGAYGMADTQTTTNRLRDALGMNTYNNLETALGLAPHTL